MIWAQAAVSIEAILLRMASTSDQRFRKETKTSLKLVLKVPSKRPPVYIGNNSLSHCPFLPARTLKEGGLKGSGLQDP